MRALKAAGSLVSPTWQIVRARGAPALSEVSALGRRKSESRTNAVARNLRTSCAGTGTDRDTKRSNDSAVADYAAEAASMSAWVEKEIDAFVAGLGGMRFV